MMSKDEVTNLEEKEQSSLSGDVMESNVLDSDFWNNLESEWNSSMSSAKDHPWLSQFEQEENLHNNYQFKEDNPMLSETEPLLEGKKKLDQGKNDFWFQSKGRICFFSSFFTGDIPSAVLLFEVAAQRNPDHFEAWHMLGTTQAKNEQDPSAIAALKKAIALKPNNLDSLMALAVSYTNESYQAQACFALQGRLLA